jgi:hypothetical protein
MFKEYYYSNKLPYFMFGAKSNHISPRKHLAEHWDLPNTGIFYSNDVASESERK